MEIQHQKLAQILEKNDTWKWLGPGNLLGDKTLTQYSGLKVFIRYVLDNRATILDKREDKGVDFVTTGDNPLCRKFIDYLRGKAEETQDEKGKQQFIWMINRAEGMLGMKEIGQMNDGILLAYANVFFALGEQAKPKIKVDENSIVGILEDGFVKSREGNPDLGKIIDGIEGKKVPTVAIAPTAPVLSATPIVPVTPAIPATPTTPKTPVSATSREESTEEEIPEDTLFGPLKPEPKPEPESKPEPAPEPETPKPAPAPTPETKKASIIEQTRAEKKVLETTKFKQPVIPTGEGTRKKQSKKRPVQKKEQTKGGPERKKEQPIQKPIARPTRKTEKLPTERRQAPLSGGWKIAKKAMKYSAGSVAGGGIIGWAATSASEAKAATLAFINFLF